VRGVLWDLGCRALVNGERGGGAHGEWWWQAEEKTGEGRMWLWWWAGARVASYGAGMAGRNTSKVEARRRVRDALARINEARAQRERANVDDAATLMVAVGKATEVDAWESERLAAVREHVRAEASRRRANCRAEAGVAIARMQQRGETLATIAELAGLGIGEIRAMLRYAPKPERHAASGGSGAPVRDAGGGQVSARLHAGGNAALGVAAAV
jgi:hypothetical protein